MFFVKFFKKSKNFFPIRAAIRSGQEINAKILSNTGSKIRLSVEK